MSNDESPVPRLMPVVSEPESWFLDPQMMPFVMGTQPCIPLPSSGHSPQYREADLGDPVADDGQMRPPGRFRRLRNALGRLRRPGSQRRPA